MNQIVKRGFVPNDKRDFSGKALETLYKAEYDLFYLLNRGYNIKGASTFIGNHYLLSERQRLALTRAVSAKDKIINRTKKEIISLDNQVINIDGFNTIITLEVALSETTLLKCMDNTIRDLAGLRGTYRLIDKTDKAIYYIGTELEKFNIKKAIFYLDAPVSNSGKLKEKIMRLLNSFNFDLEVQNIYNVDSVLENLDCVVTSDAIILDKCKSWVNLNKKIIENFQNPSIIDLSLNFFERQEEI